MKKKYVVLSVIAAIILLYFLYRALFVHTKVAVSKISKGDLVTVVYATGFVTADSMATLRSEAGGLVKYLGPREGTTVKKGELLLKTDQADQLLQVKKAESDIKTAEIDLADKKKNFERIKNLYETKSISKQEFDNKKLEYELAKLQLNQRKIALDIAKENLAKTEVYAPFNGVIVAVNVNLGDNLSPNAECFQLVVPSSLLVAGEVDEQDLSKIKLKLPAVIAFDAYQNEKFNGYIYRIVPKTNEDTKTSKVYVKLNEQPQNLNIGMTATLNIKAGEIKNTLLIPIASILKTGTGESIFVVKNDKLEKVDIKTGSIEGGKYTNLKEGNLSEGDLIVTDPAPGFENGQTIEIKNEG